MCTVELLWIPLGAGKHSVRISCGTLERLSASVEHRPACALYHSALVVTVPDGRYTIELTPVSDRHGDRRGVVAHGAVASAWLGRLRFFSYEVRCWRNGVIPDADRAMTVKTWQVSGVDAQRLLELVSGVPTPVWGRDDLGAGEMWNSNSVTSWILRRAGVDTTTLAPPAGGRAPGWDAGLIVAARVSVDPVGRSPHSRV